MKLTSNFAAIEIKEGRDEVCYLLEKEGKVPFTIRGVITGQLTEGDEDGQEFKAEVSHISTRLEYDQAQRAINMLMVALRPFANIPEMDLGSGVKAPFYWVVIGAPNRQTFTLDDIFEAKNAISEVEKMLNPLK